jgi:hypothetical protein
MNDISSRTPLHLWIVGVVSALWNAVGAFDFIATQFRIEGYMSQFPPEQLAYFHAFPLWVDVAWAAGVWGSLLGSIALLLRTAWAVGLFGVALLGLAVTTVHNFLLTNGIEIMGTGAVIFTAVIWIVAVALLLYARAMARRGWLR